MSCTYWTRVSSVLEMFRILDGEEYDQYWGKVSVYVVVLCKTSVGGESGYVVGLCKTCAVGE